MGEGERVELLHLQFPWLISHFYTPLLQAPHRVF